MNFLIQLLLFFSLTGAQSSHTLTLTFSGIKKPKGQLMVALNNASGQMIKGYKVPVTKTEPLVYTISGIAAGTYTLAVYHDINSDETLNKNLVGVPTEPYGFSNNARGTFGPPDLKDQSFKVSGATSLSITLK